MWSAPPTMKVAVEPLWLRVKGVLPAPRAATSERERVEVQRFDVLAVLVVLYELHEAQLVVLSMRWMTSSSSFLPSRLRMELSASVAGVGQRY